MKSADRWYAACLRSDRVEMQRAFEALRGWRYAAWRLLRRGGSDTWSWRDVAALRLAMRAWACGTCGREFLLARGNLPPEGMPAVPACPACKPGWMKEKPHASR